MSVPAPTLSGMPLTITEGYFDDDEGFPGLACGTDAPFPVTPWVEPDYGSIPSAADLPADPEQVRLVWPGPAMVMPGDLLPDGEPPGRDDRVNAQRITGRERVTGREADDLVGAYQSQQNALRAAAGLPRARRRGRRLEDTPETLAAIVALHEQEDERRGELWAHGGG